MRRRPHGATVEAKPASTRHTPPAVPPPNAGGCRAAQDVRSPYTGDRARGLAGRDDRPRAGGDAGIYGFVVDPPSQGRGFGREALRQACVQLRAESAQRIGLEVAVENDRALRVYSSVGFTPVSTEDYYRMAVSLNRG